MTTLALPDGVLQRMRAGHQAVRWKAVLGLEFQFRAFCCDINSDSIMGVSKQPVVMLDLTPNPVCLGNAVTWDLSDSYAPGSTILAGGYSIDMGDGTQYFASSGNHTYAAVGTYDVEATVRENGPGGRYQTIEYQVEVIDCDEPILITFSYISLDGGGVWFRDYTATPSSWVERNTGLEGNALNVNSLSLRPGDKRLPNTVHELYAATDGGVYRTFNGGRSWAKVNLPDPSNAEFADAPPAVVGDLVFHKVVYSQEDPDVLWILASSATPRLWVYTTANGIDWISRGLKIG